MTSSFPHAARLPDAATLVARVPEAAKTVARILARSGFRAWLVGGSVRDLLLERDVVDWDFATDARPEAVQAAFNRTIPTGIAHGTVTVCIKRDTFEVTTLRSEGTYSDQRRPDAVTFETSIEKDLTRRDFTINAMGLDLDADVLIDVSGGAEDLKQRVIRAVGEPSTRFQEDALRLLRAARFAAQLRFRIEPVTRAAMQAEAPGLARVSRERVHDEIVKLLAAEAAGDGLRALTETGLAAVIWPEAPRADSSLDVLGRLDAVPAKHWQSRLALWLHALKHDAEAASAWLKAHRFSKDDQRLVGASVEAWRTRPSAPDMRPQTLRRWLARMGRTVWSRGVRPLVVAEPSMQRMLAPLDDCAAAPLTLADLAVTGKDLVSAIGRPPGPWIGEVLHRLLDAVLDDPDANRPEVLLEMAAAHASTATGC